MAGIYSYDLQGQKDSFADWISNISPTDTFIVTNSKKEATPQVKYKWQMDALDKVVYDLASAEEILEGADADITTQTIGLRATTELNGVTQIFRKVFAISDSALATSVHGRAGELKLQLEKAGKELKNVMEVVFSSKQTKRDPATGASARTDGLFAMIAPKDQDNPDLPAPANTGDHAVHIEGDITKDNFEKVMYALYASGSKACCIVTNPLNAAKVNAVAVEFGNNIRQLQTFEDYKAGEMAPGKTGINEVNSITDMRGCGWGVCYSRFCPVDLVYFVHPEDLTQRVLREPKATQLGKNGSFETWQLVIEAGLCLSNPYAAGVIEVKP